MSNNLIPYSVKIAEEKEGYKHIPSATSDYNTLCGWCDVEHSHVPHMDNPITCPSCLKIVKYCKNITFKLKDRG